MPPGGMGGSVGGGARVRRVSFLVDLGAGASADRHVVRLVVTRLLTHLALQRPAPPRFAFRLYDAALSPHAFDARLDALDAWAERERSKHLEGGGHTYDETHARVHSWFDEIEKHSCVAKGGARRRHLTTQPRTIGGGGGGGSNGRRGRSSGRQASRRREFHACTPEAIDAFVRQYDDAVELYHARRDEPDEPDVDFLGLAPDASRHSLVSNMSSSSGAAGSGASEAGWFTTLARQMAATIQDAADLSAGGDDPGRGGDDDGYSLVLVLSKVSAQGAAAPLAAGSADGAGEFLKPFKGIEDALRKDATRAYLLRLEGSSSSGRGRDTDTNTSSEGTDGDGGSQLWARATELFHCFDGAALPAGLLAHSTHALPACAALDMASSATPPLGNPRLVAPTRAAPGTRPAMHPTSTRPPPHSLRTAARLSVRVAGAGDDPGLATCLGHVVLVSEGTPAGLGGGGSQASTTITVVSLVSKDQIAGAWLEHHRQRAVIAPSQSGAGRALGALLALCGAGALVEVTEKRSGGEGPVPDAREGEERKRFEPEDEDREDKEEEVMATQEASNLGGWESGGGCCATHLAVLQPITSGSMLLTPLTRPPTHADSASARATATTDRSGGGFGGSGDDATGWAEVIPTLATDAARNRRWGRMEAFHAQETDDDPPIDRCASDEAEVELTRALVAAADAAPAGVHRWERWFGAGPGAAGALGASILAAAAGEPHGATSAAPRGGDGPGAGGGEAETSNRRAETTSSEAPRLPAPRPGHSAAADEYESSREVDARFAAMIAGRRPAGAPTGTGGPVGPTRAQASRDDSREGNAGGCPPGAGAVLPVSLGGVPGVPTWNGCASSEEAVAAARAAYAHAAASLRGGAGDPDPDLGSMADSLARPTANALWLVRGGWSAGGILLSPEASWEEVMDATEKALCVSAKDLQATHRGGGCKAGKRREHTLQAHLRLACAALRCSPPGSRPSTSAGRPEAEAQVLGAKRLGKIAKEAAKLVKAVTFLLVPVGTAGLLALVEDDLAPRYAATLPRTLARVRAELGLPGAAGGGAGEWTAHGGEAGEVGGSIPGGGGVPDVFSPMARVKPPAPSATAAAAAAALGGATRPGNAADGPGDADPAGNRTGAGGTGAGGAPAAPGAKRPAAKGWHPVFRSKGVGRRREVTMPTRPAGRAPLAPSLPAPTDGTHLLLDAGVATSGSPGRNGRRPLPAPRRLAAVFGTNTPGGSSGSVGGGWGVGSMATPARPARTSVGASSAIMMTPVHAAHRSVAGRGAAAVSTAQTQMQTPARPGVGHARGGSSRGAAMVIAATPVRPSTGGGGHSLGGVGGVEVVQETPHAGNAGGGLTVVAATPLPLRAARPLMGGSRGAAVHAAAVRGGGGGEVGGTARPFDGPPAPPPKKQRTQMVQFGARR